MVRTSARLLIGLTSVLTGAAALAQTYPERPIHFVVGFAPGGAADIVARAMSEALSKSIGQTVLVENRAGAGSSIAAQYVAKAAPDGYTILLASPSSISVNPALNPQLGYKFSDLEPVLKVTTSPLVIAVNPNSAIQSLKDLTAAAKKAPGSINYATSGIGSAPHLGAALYAQVAGVQMVHVPFKGGAPAVQSVVAGDTQVTFATAPSVLALVQGGRLRALAVTSRERSPLMPDLPGTSESGMPNYAIEFWYGIFVPAHTPRAITRKLFDAVTVAMQQATVKQVLAKDGTDVSLSPSPAAFATFLASDNKFWAKLAKDAGVDKE